ncbi:MAG: hypothetical protein QNJ61_11880 [Desulfobacterales bacterium]|nr:hypothetical protein [Desulfobacterales bacterium]
MRSDIVDDRSGVVVGRCLIESYLGDAVDMFNGVWFPHDPYHDRGPPQE